MKNEFYNLGQPSKNLLERDKRLQASKLEYLKQYDQNLKEATELKEAEELNAAMSAARFSYASTYARSKNRVNKLNEEIQYNENASLVGMTEMIANVVENALLLDEGEYSAMNPEYKDQMRGTIFGLLKEAEINDVITNKDTLAIMEYVARKTPTAREGVNLTEDELSNYIAANRPENIDESIRNLSRNVSSKVAQLMEKEQAKVDKINADVKKAKAPKEKKEKEDKATAEDILAALETGELAEDDIDTMLANGEISQEVYDEVIETTSGQEDEMPEDEEMVEEEVPTEEGAEQMQLGRSIHIDPDGTTSITMPNGQLALNGDGSMDIQLMESIIDEVFDDKCILNEFNTDKYVNKTARRIADKQAGIKKGPGPLLLFLFGSMLGGVIWAIIRGVKNSQKEGKAQILYDAITSSPKCRDIVKKIEKEAMKENPDKEELKSLKYELKDTMKDEIADIKTGNSKVYSKRYVLAENRLIRETPRCGLLESLAVNEAQNMLARGEEYNPDLALANAIMYVTITEAMNEMGLLNVDDQAYSHIISAAGGNVNESAKRVYTKDNGVTELKTEKEYYNDGGERRVATKKTVTDKVSGKSYTQEESDKPNKGKGNRKYGSYGKSETLTESSVTQWGVQMNTSNSNDFAERIRQKKLLKENSQTLHD